MTDAGNATAGSNTADTTYSRAFPSNVTAGRLLIFGVRFNTAANTLSTVADSAGTPRGNTWNLLSGPYGNTNGRTGYLAWCIAASSGALTVECTHTVSEAGHTAVAEFSLSGTASMDLNDLTGASTASAGSGTTLTSNTRNPASVTTGGGISLSITSGNQTTTPATGETNVTNVAATRINILFRAFAADVDQTHSATIGVSGAWTMPLILFGDTASGGRTTKNIRAFPLGMDVGMGLWTH